MTRPTTIATGTTAGTPASSGLRPEIQALRAVAVALVVVYHFWPWKLPGGFVGVDVFFVISGFLITSHLLRDVARTGRVSLASFWARRARRLLPASLLVLLATSVAVLVLMPASRWRDVFSEIVASTLYVQNWFLASTATDYSAADASASPVQHYWSLAAEEQFYLVWPILIAAVTLAVAFVVSRSRQSQPVAATDRLRTRAIRIGLGVVVAASFVYSVYATAVSPESAYFITPTRAWEFGAGGLLAALLPAPIPATGKRRAALLSLLSLAGLAALGVAALVYSAETPFPGYAALLPVLGTLAIIAAGSPRAWFSPARAAGLAPVQFLGGISYSVYLWHWPLLMLAPYVFSDTGDHPLGAKSKFVLILLAVLLAWATKIVVEDPARSARFLTLRRPRFTLAAAAAGMVLVLVLPSWTIVQADATEKRSAELLAQLVATPDPVPASASLEAVRQSILASLPACLGALERSGGSGDCSNPALENDAAGTRQGVVIPDPSAGTILSYQGKCLDSDIKKLHSRICELGTPVDEATKTVAVIGDSHAFSLLPAIMTIAEARSWHVVAVTRGSCPFNLATRGMTDDGERQACLDWNSFARSVIEDRPEISAMFTSASAKNGYLGSGGRSGYDSAVTGAAALWREFPATVENVVVVRDVPRARQDVVECLDEEFAADSLDDDSCTSPESAVTFADPLARAAADWTPQVGDPRVTLVDPSSIFCENQTCASFIGHTIVYRDTHHIAPVFARTLAPFIVEDLPAEGFGEQ